MNVAAIATINQIIDEISLLRISVRNAISCTPPKPSNLKTNLLIENFNEIEEIRRNIARLSGRLVYSAIDGHASC